MLLPLSLPPSSSSAKRQKSRANQNSVFRQVWCSFFQSFSLVSCQISFLARFFSTLYFFVSHKIQVFEWQDLPCQSFPFQQRNRKKRRTDSMNEPNESVCCVVYFVVCMYGFVVYSIYVDVYFIC